jgi:GTP diphosphokinase / guanosine-3',5'-bis(diphosphate) 3'-diphosphatase
LLLVQAIKHESIPYTLSKENLMNMIIKAAWFAANKHRDQRRKDQAASPYINHPLALAHVLSNECGDAISDVVIVAALLHDTIEDTETSDAEIASQFGEEVLSIVCEVTDDKSLPKAERKLLQIEHAPHLSKEAKLVKLADKICNLRDMADSPPSDWTLSRIVEYFDWAKAVVDGLRGTNDQLESLFDRAYEKRPHAER